MAQTVGTKLQLRSGTTIRVVNQPAGVDLELPDHENGDGGAVIGFAADRAALDELSPVFEAAREDRLAWVAYPKAGQLGTDLNRDSLAAVAHERGVQPVRQVAIDEVWSALRLRPR